MLVPSGVIVCQLQDSFKGVASGQLPHSSCLHIEGHWRYWTRGVDATTSTLHVLPRSDQSRGDLRPIRLCNLTRAGRSQCVDWTKLFSSQRYRRAGRRDCERQYLTWLALVHLHHVPSMMEGTFIYDNNKGVLCSDR